jgi:hypothetical protein
METNLIAAGASPGGGGDVPPQFRDPQTGAVNTQALVQSYLALERRLARMVDVPDDHSDETTIQRFRRRLGVPDRPEDYPVRSPHPMIQPDPDVNAILHRIGLTPRQAQTVYDLAAERMIPAVQELAREFEADRQMERLVEHFGGADTWREVAGALRAWGRKTLPDEVFDALSTTFEGVLAMHRMMTSDEPGLSKAGGAARGLTEADLRRLMADPKYWRERDPATVKQVSEGFRKLFPGGASS